MSTHRSGCFTRRRAWPRLLELAPDYERYRARTDRRIPLVRLVPVNGA